MSLTFILDDSQCNKFLEWKKEVYKIAIEKQKNEISSAHPLYDEYKACWDINIPYCDAPEKEFTYSFTITLFGEICIVTDGITGEKLDLTQY